MRGKSFIAFVPVPNIKISNVSIEVLFANLNIRPIKVSNVATRGGIYHLLPMSKTLFMSIDGQTKLVTVLGNGKHFKTSLTFVGEESREKHFKCCHFCWLDQSVNIVSPKLICI